MPEILAAAQERRERKLAAAYVTVCCSLTLFMLHTWAPWLYAFHEKGGVNLNHKDLRLRYHNLCRYARPALYRLQLVRPNSCHCWKYYSESQLLLWSRTFIASRLSSPQYSPYLELHPVQVSKPRGLRSAKGERRWT